MKESSMIIKCMAKEFLTKKMVQDMKDNSKKGKSMALEEVLKRMGLKII